MRVLALDLGAKRIGTAVCDGLEIAIRPLETIRRSNTGRDIARIRDLVDEVEAEAVVVGMPLRLDGTVGEAAARAARFAGRLKVELSVPVFTQDERLTSFEAEEVMVSQGLNRKQRRDRSDQLAASIILRDFLSNTKQKMR